MISKSRIVTAGNRLRKSKSKKDDLDIINYWRLEHNQLLSNFKNILSRRIDSFKSDIIFGQRLKRLSTITDKLQARHSQMKITRMQDIAGCRLIFNSVKELRSFEKKLQINNHELVKIEDRINKPKDTGYRSVHYIYKYKSDSYIHNGMYIELQLRTRYHHHWATAVEIFDQIAKKRVKFSSNPNNSNAENFFKYSAEIISRAHGESNSLPISNYRLILKVLKFMILSDIIKTFDKVYLIRKYSNNILHKNAIIRIPYNKSEPKIYSSEDPLSIINKYFKLEREFPEDNIVYVLGFDDEIKECFKNYFFDSVDFIDDIRWSIKELFSKEIKNKSLIKGIFTLIILLFIYLISAISINLRRFIMVFLYHFRKLIKK